MTATAGKCPNCGAPVTFRWSGAVQTTCEYCRSVIVRHDLDLAAIGEVSDIPPDASPIQIGTEGRLDDRAFTVIGRIVYEYEDGGWNEWHLVFADGSSGWLSDAQSDYAVTSLARPDGELPAVADLKVGLRYDWQGRTLQVTTLTRARYKGVEGELPFEYWGKDEVLFADLLGYHGEFATIDCSEQPALFFAGRVVDYDELALRNVRQFDGW